MKKAFGLFVAILFIASGVGCSRAYKAKPVAFKAPEAYENATIVGDALVAARAFDDPKEAGEAFGFDIVGAGMLPVQIVFDNRGQSPLEINGTQTFLEDGTGNLWALLTTREAYERASTHSRGNQIVKEGAYHSLLGAAAGAIIGAAIGIVSGQNVGAAAGKGAAGGAAAGAVLGGAKGYDSAEARRRISGDLREKSLENRPVQPGDMAHGFLFFPAEASDADNLRLQVREQDSGTVHVVNLAF